MATWVKMKFYSHGLKIWLSFTCLLTVSSLSKAGERELWYYDFGLALNLRE